MKVLKMTTVLVLSLAMFAFVSRTNPEKTISEVVAENQDLSTLLSALEKAELVETLKGEGPYTVFAPTNQAFESLPAGKLDNWLAAENKEELAKVLKYHVVSGELYASDLRDGEMIETLDGKKLQITNTGTDQDTTSWDNEGMMEEDEESMEGQEGVSQTDVRINNAKVVESDIMASNGIIHIIDAVVMPTDVEAIGSVEDYK